MRPIFTISHSFSTLRDALMSQRAFVVRQAAAPDAVEPFAFRAADAYRRWDRKRLATCSRFAQGHIPVKEIEEEANRLDKLTGSAYLRELIAGVCGWRNPIVSERDVLLRRILPPKMRNPLVRPAIEYHQDEYLRVVSEGDAGEKQLCFTLWLPLVSCGRDAPGLTVVLGSDYPLVAGTPRGGWDAYIRDRYGADAAWSPELNAGDVLVFTSRTIHGSYVTEKMTRPRYSLEIRGGIN